ncbi:hypothetical protein [Vibrio cionasavignyae]
MQNNYVKELATKTFQEDIAKEYHRAQRRSFHSPSFIAGLFAAVIMVNLF